MRMTSHQVAVAGEALAASLFARAGCDVLIQYGPNQPDFDLVARKNGLSIPVSVKGSQEAGWGMIGSYKKGRTYHQAAEAWLADQPRDIIYCLICFWEKSLEQAPYAFLATPREIAEQHKSGNHGTGTTILYLDYTKKRGRGEGFRHAIPANWTFTAARVNELFERIRATPSLEI